MSRTYSLIAVCLLSAAPLTVRLEAAPPADLPPDLVQVRNEVFLITFFNTARRDNIPEIRRLLEPRISRLEAWFIANRPANEIELTQQSWKNLWYDDPDIDSFSSFSLGPIGFEQNRLSISQVVRDGFYYNVSESIFRFFDLEVRIQNYLKGAYTIADPATAANAGEPRLNVVDLEFVSNGIRFGGLPLFTPPSTLVDAVEAGELALFPVPGPIGVTGQLWNLYIDEDLRISAGVDDSEPDTLDLYILRRGG